MAAEELSAFYEHIRQISRGTHRLPKDPSVAFCYSLRFWTNIVELDLSENGARDLKYYLEALASCSSLNLRELL
jgi:hypothetical protein